MLTWWIVNLDTGETRRARALNESDACKATGWRQDCCDARVVPPREVRA